MQRLNHSWINPSIDRSRQSQLLKYDKRHKVVGLQFHAVSINLFEERPELLQSVGCLNHLYYGAITKTGAVWSVNNFLLGVRNNVQFEICPNEISKDNVSNGSEQIFHHNLRPKISRLVDGRIIQIGDRCLVGGADEEQFLSSSSFIVILESDLSRKRQVQLTGLAITISQINENCIAVASRKRTILRNRRELISQVEIVNLCSGKVVSSETPGQYRSLAYDTPPSPLIWSTTESDEKEVVVTSLVMKHSLFNPIAMTFSQLNEIKCNTEFLIDGCFYHIKDNAVFNLADDRVADIDVGEEPIIKFIFPFPSFCSVQSHSLLINSGYGGCLLSAFSMGDPKPKWQVREFTDVQKVTEISTRDGVALAALIHSKVFVWPPIVPKKQRAGFRLILPTIGTSVDLLAENSLLYVLNEVGIVTIFNFT